MKVCPHCNGITEETKAIKCAVCGMDITNEPEYTQEELEDDFISDELNQQHNKKIKQKKMKKILIPVGIIGIIAVIFLVMYLVKPSGYVHIEKRTYNIRIGETLEIVPEFGGNVDAEDVKIIIKETEYNGQEVSFRWWIEDNKFYIKGEKKDTLKLIFEVKDNGEQEKHNNVIYISITSLIEE